MVRHYSPVVEIIVPSAISLRDGYKHVSGGEECRRGKNLIFSLQSSVPVIKPQVLSYSLSHSPSMFYFVMMPCNAALLGLQTAGPPDSFAAGSLLDAETRGRLREAGRKQGGEKAILLPVCFLVQTVPKMTFHRD